MTHRLGLHWIRVHPDGEDLPHIGSMQYRSAKLFQWMWSDKHLCTGLLSAMPGDAFLLLRDQPMSEQKADMERDPTGTGRRHANEWAEKFRDGNVYMPVERSFCLGINEADSNHLQRQINDYNTAFLRRLREHGLRGAAGSFGVGHPSTKNLDPNGKPDWSHYEDMHRAIVEGQHILVTHEYGMPKNHGWGYWCNRIKHCPWHDVTVIVGECGIDSGVVGDRPNKGWQHYGLTPGQYADWLDVYMTQLDSRVHSVMPFTYDFSHPWGSFDVRPARRAFETHQWKSPQPIEPPPPVISPGPTEPPVQPQPTGNLFERSLQFVLLQEGGWADNPADPGGATMKGITLSTYARWRQAHGQPPPRKADLRNISDAEVRQIYHDWYWLPSGANSLPWPNCLAIFDLAVNGGVGRAQQFKNEVGTDFLAFNARRLEWYTRINGWPTFGAAWTRRVAALLKVGK